MATQFERRDNAAFLLPLSRDAFNLAYLGIAQRLRELFAEEPTLVNTVTTRTDITPLFCLPDDEEAAVVMTILLLEHGADPSVVNKEDERAEQDARRRGLTDAADLLAGDETV
jgi:hypothetical protein